MPRPSSSVSPALRELELIVMLAVLGLGDEAYPLTIRNAIVKRTGRAISRAAVFITLERLERKGFLTSAFGDPTPVRGGRAKRFFQPTRRGASAARQSLDEVAAMNEGVDWAVRS
jgi:PadR family transcriptional regulator PadR